MLRSKEPNRWRLLWTFVPTIFVCGTAIAQPFPPPPPSGVIDLGDLGVPQQVVSGYEQLDPGAVVWFRFRLTESITPNDTWLDIDTADPNVVGNNRIVLYTERGTRVSCDNDDGGGHGFDQNGRGWCGALTYGCGSGRRISGDDPIWGGGAISDGRDGWLPAGVYYLGIVGWYAGGDDCQGWATFNPGWNHQSDSTVSGSVRVRLETGTPAPSFWNETRHGGGDAGGVPDLAMSIDGAGAVDTIVGRFAEHSRDVFKIQICNPTAFQVSAFVQETRWHEGYAQPAKLFLFDSTGRGIAGINNQLDGTDTVLTAPHDLTAGEYYLAISSNCGGDNGYLSVPYDASSQPIWDFQNPSSHNIVIPPNGPGADNPMAFSGSQSDCSSNDDWYHFKLSLTGVCFVSDSCVPDVSGDGIVDLTDLGILLAAYGMTCP